MRIIGKLGTKQRLIIYKKYLNTTFYMLYIRWFGMISENEVGKMLEKIEADIKEIESKIEENKKMNNKENNLMIWKKLLEVLSTMKYLADNQWENNEVRNKIIKLNEKVSELINVATKLNKKKK